MIKSAALSVVLPIGVVGLSNDGTTFVGEAPMKRPRPFAHFSAAHRVELRRETVRAVERMAHEVDNRDPYTFQHSQRVAIYSHAIARTLRFGATDIELVELAAKVHDIGKIRIPDAILLKPGVLTPDERRVMETHPRVGFEILRPFSEYA